MENTKNINVISTPNIEGNIGSCTVKNDEVKVGTTFFTEDYQSVQINSCTGEVISTNRYTDYSLIWVLSFIGFVALVCLIGVIVESTKKKTRY